MKRRSSTRRVRIPGRRRTFGGRQVGNKFGAVPTLVDGIRFASKKEAKRYRDLKLREQAGEIQELTLQPRYPLIVRGPNGQPVKVGVFTGDFLYVVRNSGEVLLEDAKSPITRKGEAYRLRKRLFEALYGFRIEEV